MWLLFTLVFLKSIIALSLIRPFRAFLGKINLFLLSSLLGLSVVLAGANNTSITPALFVAEMITFVFAVSPIALLCESFALVGKNADTLRGADTAAAINPSYGVNESPLEALMLLGSVLFIFHIGSHLEMFSLISSLSTSKSQLSLAEISKVIVRFISILSPVILVSVLTDIYAAFLSRTLQGVNLVFELLGAKLLLGISAFFMAIYLEFQ